MKIKKTERQRVPALRSMLRAAVKTPCIVFTFPCVGLCDVWAYDGFAWIFPGSGGVIRAEWFQVMRHIRRHI